VYDLAAQWHYPPWLIDIDSLSARDVDRSRLYANYQAQVQATAARRTNMRKTLG